MKKPTKEAWGIVGSVITILVCFTATFFLNHLLFMALVIISVLLLLSAFFKPESRIGKILNGLILGVAGY